MTGSSLKSRAAAASPVAGAAVGRWIGEASDLAFDAVTIRERLHDLSQPVFVVRTGGALGVTHEGMAVLGAAESRDDGSENFELLGAAPAMGLAALGDPSFCADHQIRFPYMTGAMANGIASVELVIAAARAGVLGSFGAAGLRVPQIAAAIDAMEAALGEVPFAVNLIHSPNESAHEMAVVELYLKRKVRLVEASAFMDLTLPAVLYRVHGIHQAGDGRIVTPNRIIAKISRIEVATRWFSPPPERLLSELVAMGRITREQAALAARVPMAQDITAEADSGGHTDNRPAITLIPTILALRDRMQQQFGYAVPLRVGAAGGVGTPASAAAAFAMGAAYVVTGSINQACVESGSSDRVRQMLAQTEQADVTMAPAADMFEMGVKLQVLKRGTMFAMRAAKLFELYRSYGSIDEIPAAERQQIEKTIFRDSLEAIWEKTQQFFLAIDPTHIERAARDPKHKMALVFRWYLGLSSRWANAGDAGRQMDYQIWCGPAMGAFNEWAKGSFLEAPAQRDVATVAMNILYGAGVCTRVHALRAQGVRLGAELTHVAPKTLGELEDALQ